MVGFIAMIVLSFLPVLGPILAGFAAGVVAGGGAGKGALAGFLSGIIGAIVAAIILSSLGAMLGGFRRLNWWNTWSELSNCIAVPCDSRSYRRSHWWLSKKIVSKNTTSQVARRR